MIPLCGMLSFGEFARDVVPELLKFLPRHGKVKCPRIGWAIGPLDNDQNPC
jgi:hypothetical protein